MKAIYIFTYDDGNSVEPEWFVGEYKKDYNDQVKMAYNYLHNEIGMSGDIENIYIVDKSMIKEVFKSYKKGEK